MQHFSKVIERIRIQTLLAVWLILLASGYHARAQEDSQQSVAEAAKSARNRQQSTIPARVLDNEEPNSRTCDNSYTDQQLREQLEIVYRPPMNKELAAFFQADSDATAPRCCNSDPDSFLANNKATNLGDLDVPFPGRREWEDQLRNALDNLLDERKKRPEAIRAIEDANRSLIDSASSSPDDLNRREEVRQQLITAMIPDRRWMMRYSQLQTAGRERAEAYQKSPIPARALNQPAVTSPTVVDDPYSDSHIRTLLEKGFPPPLSTRSAKDIQDNADLTAFVYSHPDVSFTIQKSEALREYSMVSFPGRSEWEDQLHNMVDALAQEAKKLPAAVRTIEDSNRSIIEGGDCSRDGCARMKEVRRQLIDAMIPQARWQMRLAVLQQEGKARAKAYLAGSHEAMAQYRRSRVPLAEEAVGSGMIWLGRAQQEYRKAYGHYTCDLQDFKFGPKVGPHSANLFSENISEYQKYDYALTLQGCDDSQGQHYQAVASAPSPDGTQGRSFCSDDSGAVRIGTGGQAVSCLSRGQTWLPKGWKP